jgi:hypothetical protein
MIGTARFTGHAFGEKLAPGSVSTRHCSAAIGEVLYVVQAHVVEIFAMVAG